MSNRQAPARTRPLTRRSGAPSRRVRAGLMVGAVVAVLLSASGTGNTITQPVAVTNASGVATGTLVSTAAGEKIVTATVGGTAIVQSDTVTVTAGAVSAAQSTVSASLASMTG